MAMRLLHLYWPHLLLDLAERRSGSFPPGPVVIGGRPWANATVLDVNHAARELGIRRGMALGSAHRLAPEAAFVDPAPDHDREAVEAAFQALAHFSPGLAGTSDPADRGFGLVAVQVDGLDVLWGPEPVLARRLARALASLLPGAPRMGIAGTWFAATLAAGLATSGGLETVPANGETAWLAPLPARLLTEDPDVRARLARFGLGRIGAVAGLPRSALVARFGEEGARLHARANGQEVRPFHVRRAPERLALALPIDPPVLELQAVRFVLHRLATALAAQLQGRGAAAGRARLALELDLAFAPAGTAPGLVVELRFPEPTADAEAIERLLLARLEREPPPAAIARLELELAGVEPAAGQQLPLFTPQAAREARLGWQIARLALTHGEDRIRRVRLLDPESPLAERRWGWS
jgi:protein ImuB